MLARFWGVTGTVSAPCLASDWSAAVGNTTCIELGWEDRTVVYDGGTGFISFGEHVLGQLGNDPKATKQIDLVLSHPHFDHINGLLFSPLIYDPRASITLHASASTLSALGLLLGPDSGMSRVFLPSTFSDMQGLRRMVEIEPGRPFMLGDARVETMALRHPGGCLAFRVTRNGASMVLASDHEHPVFGADADLARFSKDANLVYTEGQYTRAEYEGKEAIGAGLPIMRRGWGHSAMEDCVATAISAGCQRLILGHHDPLRPLDSLKMITENLRALVGPGGPSIGMAREGESIVVS